MTSEAPRPQIGVLLLLDEVAARARRVDIEHAQAGLIQNAREGQSSRISAAVIGFVVQMNAMVREMIL